MNFDDYSTKEIRLMIVNGRVDEQDVVDFYCNEWWDENSDD